VHVEVWASPAQAAPRLHASFTVAPQTPVVGQPAGLDVDQVRSIRDQIDELVLQLVEEMVG
jgi:hypothetical protein